MKGAVAAEEVLGADVAERAAATRGRAKRLKAMAKSVKYTMDRDKVVLESGRIAGRISLLLSWDPPSTSARCHMHEESRASDCSARSGRKNCCFCLFNVPGNLLSTLCVVCPR